MGIGTSIFLIAVGAILDFAVSVNTKSQGFDLHTIGVILMVVGAIGAVLSLVFWSSWGGFGGRGDGVVSRDTVVYDDQPRRRIVRDEIV
jgi:hypothetical protein